MTATSPNPGPAAKDLATKDLITKDANDYLQLWNTTLSEVLEQVCGAPCPVDSSAEAPSGALPKAEGDLYFLIASTGALRGEICVRVAESQALSLAQRMLGETTPTSQPSEQRNAVEEFFRQVGGRAATLVGSAYGEVQLRVESASPPTWAIAATSWMATRADAAVQLTFEWLLSAALAAELAAAVRAANSTASESGKPLESVAPAQAPEPASPIPLTSSAADSLFSANHLDLFKDVELDVTLRFGGRRMLLREILDLGPGVVIELDRQVQEPVDMLLDGRTIARGEVVVVEGNYGLRVLEVPGSSQ
jgi:flagellar motor switch protein FliN